MSSLFGGKKKASSGREPKDAKPASPHGRKNSAGKSKQKGAPASPSPPSKQRSSTALPDPKSNKSKPDPKSSPKTPGLGKHDDDDDFWGTDKSKTPQTPPLQGQMPMGAPSAGVGMPATPHGYQPQFAVPPGYMPMGFSVDQFGQPIVVLLHLASGQQFYQPAGPTFSMGGMMNPTGNMGGAPSYPPASPSFPQGYTGMPTGGSGGVGPTGNPMGGGYPSAPTNGGSGLGSPMMGGGYLHTNSNGGSGVTMNPSGGFGYPQQPIEGGYNPQNPSTNGSNYMQPTNFTNMMGGGAPTNNGTPTTERPKSPPSVDLNNQNPSSPHPGNQPLKGSKPLPPRPDGGKDAKSPSLKRQILLNQHRFGEEFGNLSMMREARVKARAEERKKTGGIKVLPTLKGMDLRKRREEERVQRAAKMKEETERKQKELEAKIQREAEERARQQEEQMLREVEEKVKREEEEKRRAWEEEMKRKLAEEQRQWAEEEARVLAQLEDEKKKRTEAEERIKLEKERKKQELAELQRVREEQIRQEQQRKMEEEQKALAEKIEREKNWAKQSFNPAAFKKQMELKLREEMERQLKEEQEKRRQAEKMVWEVRPEDVTTDRPLGKGAFGMVYSGKLHGKRVAIKTILMENMNDESIASFKKEVDIMTKLRHPNILLFMGACFQPGHFMLITELMPKGSLDKIIHEKKEPLTFKKRMHIAKDTALGMNWLHSLNPPLLHLDLKLGNLLVDEGWNVKVADFGLSKMKSDCVTDEGFIGSPFYMAPEMLQEKEYNEKADVYSFGIVLWELYTMQTPYAGRFSCLEEFIDAIVIDEERPEIPADCPKTLRDLIESCWQTDPNARPSFKRLLKAYLFDCIIIEAVIKDNEGRMFWKEKFMEQDTVEWDEFLPTFIEHYNISEADLPSTCASAKAFKATMVPQGDVVTVEAFGNMLEWFGPLKTGMDVIRNVVDTVSQPWFHGELTREAAELLLKPKKEGTFLVRFSASTPGSFTLSVKQQKKKFIHLRISRTPEGRFEYNKQVFPTLNEIIKAFKGQWNLRLPCSGSSFQGIFTTPGQVQEEEDYVGENYGDFGQLTRS